MAAIGSLFLSLLSQGDELVIHPTVYSNTVSVTGNALPRFGIRVVKAFAQEQREAEREDRPFACRRVGALEGVAVDEVGLGNRQGRLAPWQRLIGPWNPQRHRT